MQAPVPTVAPSCTATVGALGAERVAARLRGEGLTVRAGPFSLRVRSPIRALADDVSLLYADAPVRDDGFADFHVAVEPPRSLRRWVRPQVAFRFDGRTPFKPLPASQALPLLEWGLNWCIAMHAHRYLILHAAAVERGGRVLLMPGPPGSGKSTLCAGLVGRGWRLLSDELALISLDDGLVRGIARPVSLKNESIRVIREFLPDATLSRPCPDTAKGTVALMRAPADSARRACEPAAPAWVVVPRFEPSGRTRIGARSRAATCMELADNAFNYSIHGRHGFALLGALVDACTCHDLDHRDLEGGIDAIESLVN